MIKGVNHTIIEVANPANRYFERALLFVRPKWEDAKETHLQKEADRLLESVGKPPSYQTLSVKERRKYRTIKRAVLATGWWLLGAGCGYGLAALLYLI